MLWPIIWATIFLYITFHTIQGERGLIAFMQIHGEVLAAKKIQQTLISKKNRLQNQVALLSLKSLDIDMLEERVRIMLGYSRPNETIILLK
jgi:cell division protein FtsB